MALSTAGLAQAPLFTALALSTTAIGALLPMLRDAGLLAPPYGPMILAAGAIGEALPVVAFSLVLAGTHAPAPALVMLLLAAGAIAAVVAAARASGRFAKIVERTMETSGQLPMRLAIFLLVLLVVLSYELEIDLVLGAFAAGAVARAALPHHHASFAARLDGVGSGFLVPNFFVTSGIRLDFATLFRDLSAFMMVTTYSLLMLLARGLPALLLYRPDLSNSQRGALALHSATQLPIVVAITGIAMQRGVMPGAQGTALVGGAILTMILFPMLARLVLQERKDAGATSSEPH